MIGGEAVADVSEIISVLPPEVAERIGGLITILKAAGIAFLIYVAYLIVSFVLNFKRYRKLGVLEKKVDSVDKKMDRLLKFKKK